MHRIFLVDPHPVLRLGFATLVDGQNDMEVCGETDSGREVVRRIPDSKPDLIVAEIALPDMSGLELIRELHVICPALPVLIYSNHDEMLYAERVIRSGGRGFVSKFVTPDAVVEALLQTANGGIFLSREMTDHLLRSIAAGGNRPMHTELVALSDRELEVFGLIGRGKGTQDIAEQLSISIHTVETHRARIREKLRLPNAAEIIRHAVLWVESDFNGRTRGSPDPILPPTGAG